MRRTAHKPNELSVNGAVTVIATVLLLLPFTVKAAAATNRIQDVRIAETQGRTIVSIVGSSKPEFTAFKLNSPTRLVIDVAQSQVRGVPSLIDTQTRLLEGVAVSQYSVKGVPVTRIMLGFKTDAAYRVSIKGNTLTATLAGSPSELKSDTQSKEVPNAAVANETGKEIAALQDENKKYLENYKAVEAKAQKAEQQAENAYKELSKWQKEAASAKAEAASAKNEQARLEAELKSATAKALEAEKQLSEVRLLAESSKQSAVNAKKEIDASKMSVEQAMKKAESVKAEMLRLRMDAVEARKKAAQAEEELTKFRELNSKTNQNKKAEEERSLTLAQHQISAISKQAKEAESTAQKEQEKRKNLEDRLSLLQKELEIARNENRTSEAARLKAEDNAKLVQDKLNESRYFLDSARREAMKAKASQNEAAKAYDEAVGQEREKLLKVLKEKEKETLVANQRAESALKENQRTENALVSAKESLQKAILVSKAKEDERVRADNALKDLNLKYAEAASAMREWESRASEMRREITRKEQEIAEIKRKALLENEEIRKSGDQKIAFARAALSNAEAAERAASKKLLNAEEKLQQYLADAEKAALKTAELEKELVAAKSIIADREREIRNLTAAKAVSDKAAEDAARALSESSGSKNMQAATTVSSVKTGNESKPKMTQEEQRIARLEKMKGDTKKILLPVSQKTATKNSDHKKPEENGNGLLPTISAIDFKSDKDSQKVIIRTSHPLEYSLSTDPTGNASLTFKNAKLAPLLERTLDVTDFGGIVSNVSSYQKDGHVIVKVGVEQASLSTVERNQNTIEVNFMPKAQSFAAQSKVHTPLGKNSRTVAVESGETYAHPYERTAASAIGGGSGKKKKYTGRRVDLDFKDADIHNILRLLADVGHVNIVTGDDVKGSVTIRMRDVAWDHALDIILQSKQLGMIREGNLIRVAPQSVLEQEREMEIARRKQRIALEPLETRLIPISYANASELMPRAQDLSSERGKLSVDARTNVIIARDTKDTLNQIEALIRNLDTQTPQVLIESRIVEATSLFSREIGIQWGGDFAASSATGNPTGLAFPSSLGIAGGATDSKTPMEGLSTAANGQPNPNFGVNLPAPVGTNSGGALGITLGSIANNANLSLRLSAMEETGTLRILSSPKILTLDNREAHIEQGTLIPYSQVSAQGVQTAFKEAKLNLTVTPHVTADGSVLLKMRVMRDEPDFNNTGAGGDPTILKREAETELLVSDGHTAVIGGIFTRNAGTSFKKVPFFADIPILGWLFKKKSDSDRRSEMLIFITPRIVNRAESIGR